MTVANGQIQNKIQYQGKWARKGIKVKKGNEQQKARSIETKTKKAGNLGILKYKAHRSGKENETLNKILTKNNLVIQESLR